jgi:UDP-N-acetylglucosamine acyltransferase
MATQRVDPSASVHPSARIADDARIGPYCVIGADVEIGARSVLVSHITVESGTTLGADNTVSPMTVLGGAPQVVTYRDEPTRLVIGSRNRIREFVSLHRGSPKGHGVTTVGDDNYLMAYTHIAHDCRVGSETVFANAATLAGHVDVDDGAFVGAFCGVHQFCRVAREAFIGGYSVVTRDALPWVLTVGNRAKSHGINHVGLKRKGYDRVVIDALKKTYKTLFRSKLRLEDALARVEAELGSIDEVRYFVEFVRASQRGVTR